MPARRLSDESGSLFRRRSDMRDLHHRHLFTPPYASSTSDLEQFNRLTTRRAGREKRGVIISTSHILSSHYCPFTASARDGGRVTTDDVIVLAADV